MPAAPRAAATRAPGGRPASPDARLTSPSSSNLDREVRRLVPGLGGAEGQLAALLAGLEHQRELPARVRAPALGPHAGPGDAHHRAGQRTAGELRDADREPTALAVLRDTCHREAHPRHHPYLPALRPVALFPVLVAPRHR